MVKLKDLIIISKLVQISRNSKKINVVAYKKEIRKTTMTEIFSQKHLSDAFKRFPFIWKLRK